MKKIRKDKEVATKQRVEGQGRVKVSVPPSCTRGVANRHVRCGFARAMQAVFPAHVRGKGGPPSSC
jgi:hypothetical protein